jgi:hypothetical protein
MESLKLSEIEQAYYNELFQTCDVEGTGKITGMKASELFLASSLPPEALKQVCKPFIFTLHCSMLGVAYFNIPSSAF